METDKTHRFVSQSSQNFPYRSILSIINTMTASDFTITFRGVRGGYPKPGSSTVRYGGNTSCYEIRAGNFLIIVDAGTGIISLGDELMQHFYETNEPIHCTLLLTHLHHDHTQGIPFFAPLYHPLSCVNIYGPHFGHYPPLEDQLIQLIQPPYSPLGSEKLRSQHTIQPIGDGDILICKEAGQPPQLLPPVAQTRRPPGKFPTIQAHYDRNHPRDGVMMYRVNFQGRSIVVATDTEGVISGNQELIHFAYHADLLLHDGEYEDDEYAHTYYSRQGWGHSTWRMAMDIARVTGVKRLGIIHHNHAHDDSYLDEIEYQMHAIMPTAFIAREGVTFDI